MLPAAFMKNMKSKKTVKSAMSSKKILSKMKGKAAPKKAKSKNPFADRLAGMKMKGSFKKEQSVY